MELPGKGFWGRRPAEGRFRIPSGQQLRRHGFGILRKPQNGLSPSWEGLLGVGRGGDRRRKWGHGSLAPFILHCIPLQNAAAHPRRPHTDVSNYRDISKGAGGCSCLLGSKYWKLPRESMSKLHPQLFAGNLGIIFYCHIEPLRAHAPEAVYYTASRIRRRLR